MNGNRMTPSDELDAADRDDDLDVVEVDVYETDDEETDEADGTADEQHGGVHQMPEAPEPPHDEAGVRPSPEIRYDE